MEAKKASGRWRTRRVDDVLDAELAWADFRAFSVREKSEAKGRRFIRFNPDLDREPPAQDSKSDMEGLQANVRKRLQTPHRLAALRNVAHRLVASSFYLDLQAKATPDKYEQLCSGVIACRFEDGSMEMCALGRILEERHCDDFEPYFLIKPDADDNDMQSKVFITMDVIRGMTDHAVFGLPNIYVPLRNETRATSMNLFLSPHDGLEPDGFPISGFPRVLLGEPAAAHSRKSARGSSEQSLRSPTLRRANHRSRDGDSLSLNGPTPGGPTHHNTRSGSSEDSWQDTQSRISAFVTKDGRPKMSLADLIAQHQNSGSSIRQRTNRFWTYIGNNHMALHPEMYSHDELARYAGTTGARPVELPTPSEDSGASYISPTLTSDSTPQSSPRVGTHELEARDKATRELQRKHDVAATHGLHPNQLHPSARQPIPSVCQPEFEDEYAGEGEDSSSTFSGHEAVQVQVAQASPVVQVRMRNSLDSILSLYGDHGSVY